MKIKLGNRHNLRAVSACFLLLFLAMIGCGKENYAQNSLKSNEESQEKDAPIMEDASDFAESDTGEITEDLSQSEQNNQKEIDFVDAWGEWHHMIINPEVSPCPYDWQKLSCSADGRFTYADESYVIHHGVDISHHQGDIDWNRVKNAGIDFAMIRFAYRGYGTTGKLCMDTKGIENIRKAQEAGIKVGVYVFSQAINIQEALEEADLVIEGLNGIVLDLPVVFDPELIRDEPARTDGIDGEQFTDNTVSFCERIKEAGYQPMVYSNLVWESEIFDMETIQRYPIWYADYEPLPQTPYDFVMWQYSESGYVDGIKGQTDLDVWFEKIS